MQLFSNRAQTYLASTITETDTQITVEATTGGLFSSPTGEDYELLLLTDMDKYEVVKLTSRQGDVLTVERGVEGGDYTWPQGTVIKNTITERTMNNTMQQEVYGPALNLMLYRLFV